jgi:hypothetical protein
MTLGIAHRDHAKQVVVIDALREQKPPLSPELVVEEFASTLRSYNITKVTGDRYAGVWPAKAFARFGITYDPSAAPKRRTRRLTSFPMTSAVQAVRRTETIERPARLSAHALRAGTGRPMRNRRPTPHTIATLRMPGAGLVDEPRPRKAHCRRA